MNVGVITKLLNFFFNSYEFYEPGAPVAQWLKRSPADLAVPSSSPARGGNLSNRKQSGFHCVFCSSSSHRPYITEILLERTYM